MRSRGWDGLASRCRPTRSARYATIEWLVERAARARDRRITLRLVKGAYWDSEIKRAQERGLAGYPVFTRKANTDVSYLACARAARGAGERIYPQFATHNAHTVALSLEVFGRRRNRLRVPAPARHGRGAVRQRRARTPAGRCACRVYAPVGAHEDLLPYLVRRLLENGANTSFVNRIVDASAAGRGSGRPTRSPKSMRCERVAHPRIPLPRGLSAGTRSIPPGFNLADGARPRALLRECARPRAAVERGADRRRPAARRARHAGRSIRPTRPTYRRVADADARPWTGDRRGGGGAADWDRGRRRRARACSRVRPTPSRRTRPALRRALRARGRQDLPDAHR